MTSMELVEKAQLTERPRLKAGDTVRVHVRVKEGDKERIQIFEGVVIGLRRGGNRASFTVRKVSFSQGVERIFPLHSPTISKVEVVRSAKVRRAKLYFLRDLKGKAARMKAGDTVRVHVRVKEGDKERIQIFEGVVIGLRRGGNRATFTVRKVSFSQGVERIFPLHSPTISKVEVVRSAKVRRAKLYFLRDLKGKAARMKEVKKTN